jgi:hypothetical protein
MVASALSIGLSLLGVGCNDDDDNQAPPGPYERYTIETDLGDIFLDIAWGHPFRPPNYAGLSKRIAQLELPSAILIRLDPKAIPNTQERVVLYDVDIILNGATDPVQFEKRRFAPIDGDSFTLQLPAQALVPHRPSDDTPIALFFDSADTVTIRLRPGKAGDTTFPIATAEWPRFDVGFRVWTNLSDPDAKDAVLKHRSFKSPLDPRFQPMLLVDPAVDEVIADSTSLGFRFLSIEDQRSLYVRPSRSEMYWRPGWLQLSLGPSARTEVTVSTSSSKPKSAVVSVQGFAIVQRDPEVVASQTRTPLDEFFSTVDVTTDDRFTALVLQDAKPAPDSPLEIPSGSVTVAGKVVELTFVSTPSSGPTRWCVRAFLFPTGKRTSFLLEDGVDSQINLVGLGIGTFAPHSQILASNCTYVIQSDGAARLIAKRGSYKLVSDGNSTRWLRAGDYLINADTILNPSLQWTEDHARATVAIGSAILCKENLQLAWAGNSAPEPSNDDVWMHLAPCPDTLPPNLRAPASQSNEALIWQFDDKSHTIAPYVPPNSPNDATCTPSAASAISDPSWLVHLSRGDFGPSLRADRQFAGGSDTYFLPPFTLREHPPDSALDQWVQPQNPTFKSRFMFEPRTRAVLDCPPDDTHAENVLNRLKRFASRCRQGLIEFASAGIWMRGRFDEISASQWAPNGAMANSAPYLGISVDSLDLASIPTSSATSSQDLSSPQKGGVRDTIDQGLHAPGCPAQAYQKLSVAIKDPTVPVAISPIGGTMALDWQFGEQAPNGLVALGLHSYLGRYDNNYAIQNHLMLPWGLRFQVVTRLFRDRHGEISYCQNWSFIEPEQVYGPDSDVRIHNLRPLNSSTWRDPQAFEFLADFDIRQDSQPKPVQNKRLRGGYYGIVPATPIPPLQFSESVPFPELADLPRTLFSNSVFRVQNIVWSCTADHSDFGASSTGCTPPGSIKPYVIQVSAEGTVWHTGPIQFDDPRVVNQSQQSIDPNSGSWTSSAATNTIFNAQVLTVGQGLTRVRNPLPDGKAGPPFVRDSADYTVVKKLGPDDLFILDLLPGNIDAASKNKIAGTLTLRYHYDNGSANTQDAVSFTGTIDYPDLTPLAKAVCDAPADLSLGCQPKHFKAEFGTSTPASVMLTFDLGVKGVFVLKDTVAQISGNGGPQFHFGSFAPCPGLFALLFSDLLTKLSGLAGNGKGFQIFPSLTGLTFQWPISLPNLPLGGGSLSNLQFHFRTAFRFDFTSGGQKRGVFSLFAIGIPDFKGLEGFGLDWLAAVQMLDLGMSIMPHIEPVTLTISPFTVRFKSGLGFRAIPSASGDLPRLEAFACIEIQGGLALEFSIEIIKGGVSITLALRWCPTLVIDPNLRCVAFDPSHLAIGIVIDGHACVIEMINIKVYAEIMALLKLGCPNPKQTLEDVEFSGYASIDLFMVSIRVDFHVNFDAILGLTHCDTPAPCMALNGRPTPDQLHVAVMQHIDDAIASLGVAA